MLKFVSSGERLCNFGRLWHGLYFSILPKKRSLRPIELAERSIRVPLERTLIGGYLLFAFVVLRACAVGADQTGLLFSDVIIAAAKYRKKSKIHP